MPCFLRTICTIGIRWNGTNNAGLIKKIETNKRRKAPSIPGCPTAFPDKLKNFSKARVALTNKSNFGVNVREIGIRKICHYSLPPKISYGVRILNALLQRLCWIFFFQKESWQLFYTVCQLRIENYCSNSHISGGTKRTRGAVRIKAISQGQ